jgi:hypothetical protein
MAKVLINDHSPNPTSVCTAYVPVADLASVTSLTDVCPVCTDPPDAFRWDCAQCKKPICMGCAEAWAKLSPSCPCCRADMHFDDRMECMCCTHEVLHFLFKTLFPAAYPNTVDKGANWTNGHGVRAQVKKLAKHQQQKMHAFTFPRWQYLLGKSKDPLLAVQFHKEVASVQDKLARAHMTLSLPALPENDDLDMPIDRGGVLACFDLSRSRFSCHERSFSVSSLWLCLPKPNAASV